VAVLVGPGQNHETYVPSPRQVAKVTGSRVYFSIGLPFEKGLLPKIASASGNLAFIDTTEGIPFRKMEAHGHEAEHGLHEPGESDMEHPDPHVWLAPAMVKILARNTADGLAQADSVHAEEYMANLATFLKRVDALDALIRNELGPFDGRRVYVYHPAYGYFTDAYGLEQVPIEWEGKSPSPRELEEVIAKAKGDNVKVIFVQPQFDQRTARKVAESIGGSVALADPLAEDVLANLEAMALAIRNALSP
jgi:zinc transport system substrate-binding protein